MTTSPINWDKLFSPASVAIIGASNTKGSWGASITSSVLAANRFRVYPVNPKSPEVLGVKAYPSISSVPEVVDLAVIVVSAPMVPGVLRDCVAKGIKTGLIISAAFAETGEQGQILEDETRQIANEGGLHFIGPNTLGHANTRSQLSTFGWPPAPVVGPVAVLSQSGSLTLTLVRMGQELGINYSKYVSTGNEASLHMEDYIEYLAQDEDTHIIAAYIEGLREGRRFFEIAKKLTLRKPIVVLKAGGTEEAAKAVRSHTAALAGSDAVYSAAFRQAGVIRVEDEEELTDVVFALLNCPLPRSNRAAIVSIGGGMGALTTEACEREGLALAQLTPASLAKLDALLPARWSHRNPVDLAGLSGSEYPLIINCVLAVMEDENVDAVFVQAPLVATKEQLTSRAGLKPEEIRLYREQEKANVAKISRKVEQTGKMVFFAGRGLRNDPDVSAIFKNEKLILFSYSRRAARLMRILSWYRQYLDNNSIK